MSVVVAILGNFILRLEVFNNDRLSGAHLEPIRFGTLSKEDLNGLLVTELNRWVHREALTVPEVVQVTLADPFFGPFRVDQVLGVQLDALVVLDVHLELLVTDHCVPEKTVLVTALLLFVVDQFVDEVMLDRLLELFHLSRLLMLQQLVGGGVL